MNSCWVFGGRNERDVYLNKVRFGLIGGGFGALIGRVHKMAAELSGSAELVCGAFSRDPNQSKKAVSSCSVSTLADHIQMLRRCV